MNLSLRNSQSKRIQSHNAIIAGMNTIFVVALICIFLYEYRNGRPPYFFAFMRYLLATTGYRPTAQSGTPIHIGKVAKNAFITTLTLGLAGICSLKRLAKLKKAILSRLREGQVDVNRSEESSKTQMSLL